MIKHIKIINNRKSLLCTLWGPKEIKLSENVNIIFSPNGTGKSVMLKGLAYFTSCQKGGWSTGLDPLEAKLEVFSPMEIDYVKLKNKKSKIGAMNIDWDGTPTYYSKAMLDDSSQNMQNALFGMNQEMSLEDAIVMHKQNLSQGQTTITHLNNIFQSTLPDITLEKHTESNNIWQKAGRILSDYVKTLPRDGKPTILLDEPDRSFDFINQRFFWENVNKLAEKFQLIITTHSMFVLTDIAKDFNIIEITPGYYKKAKEIIKV
jgi:predicted ATPase